MFYAYRRDVVALINAARLPAIYPEREYADDRGLMAYGTNVPDNFRRAADYVDRILKGAKARRPADPGARQVRFRRQPQDRPRAGADDPARDPRPCRRGHRMRLGWSYLNRRPS